MRIRHKLLQRRPDRYGFVREYIVFSCTGACRAQKLRVGVFVCVYYECDVCARSTAPNPVEQTSQAAGSASVIQPRKKKTLKNNSQAHFHSGPTPKLFLYCCPHFTPPPTFFLSPPLQPPFFFFTCFYSEVRWKLSLLPRSVAFEWYQTSAQVHRAPKTATE